MNSMNRPLFRPRHLDPSKRIRLLVDPHEKNSNDLTNSISQSSSSSSSSSPNLRLSLLSTSTQTPSSQQTLGPTSQPCVQQIPFVSGMEREEETEYHLQDALDAQRRLGSAKIRAVPIPNLYEDRHCLSIYPPTVELPKQLIRLQPLQLESDEPEYDMDQIDHQWFDKSARNSCPELTHREYEVIVDQLENASTRTLISLDEARVLFASATPSINNELHIKTVYDFWHQRRTAQNQRLKPYLLTERDVKEEKGKHHPYVAFRRRVEKMTTRKNRKNDEQAYMSMLKLRSSFEAVVKLTNLIKLRETTKASWLECAQAIFQTRCDCKADDDTLSTNTIRSHLKTSSLMNSNSNPLQSTPHQRLMAQLMRIENQKKNKLSSSTLAGLLQTPIQARALGNDLNDPFQQKIKRFKASHKKNNHTDKLTQLLSSPTTPASPHVHSVTHTPQSIFERLSSSNIVYSSSQQQAVRRRLKNSLSGSNKPGKVQRNLSSADLWSLAESTSSGAILLKAQLLEAARKLQQKEELENTLQRQVIMQDGSSVISNTNENLNNRLEGTTMEEEEPTDPWQFRPKLGCRYLRPIDQDQQQQQRVPVHRANFSSFHSLCSSERGQLGKRRIRFGRGGRLLYDRHIEQENQDESTLSSSKDKSYFTEKSVLWNVSAHPSLNESYRFHSHLTVEDHTISLVHHYQSKSSHTICLDDSFYHVNNSHPFSSINNTTGKSKPSESIEFNQSYSCSFDRVHQALTTLIEPQPPSPTTSPPLPPATNSLQTSEQIILISTPPTPPPPLTMINNSEIDPTQQEQPFYTKSSTTYVLSPSTPYYPAHVVPSTSPPPPSSPSSCALVQYVQLHRILPSTKSHNYTSTTPVTSFDS